MLQRQTSRVFEVDKDIHHIVSWCEKWGDNWTMRAK